MVTLGRGCGIVFNNTDATQYPFLFFNMPNNLTNILSRTICVKACPKNENATIECLTTSFVKDCKDLTAYETGTAFKSFCVPNKQELLSKVASMFAGFNIQSIFTSLYINRFVFLACIGVAFLISYLFTYLLDWFTWLIVLISIVGTFAIGIYLSILSWKRYQKLKNEPMGDENKDNLEGNASIYKWIAISLWIILTLLLLMLMCLFDRVKLATECIQAASDFVGEQIAITLVPVLSVLVVFGFMVYWLIGLAFIFSTGELYHNKLYPWGKVKIDNIK